VERSKTRVLVQAAQLGDRKALEELFSRYLPRVRRIVALRLGCSESFINDHEDVVQEAMLAAFRSLPGCRNNTEGSFRNWLARCVENRILNLYRKHRSGPSELRLDRLTGGGEQSRPAPIIDPRQDTPSAIVQALELGDQILHALLRLPKHTREIIILRHLCGMTYAEIAREFGFERVETARVALYRALQRLRKVLGSCRTLA